LLFPPPYTDAAGPEVPMGLAEAAAEGLQGPLLVRAAMESSCTIICPYIASYCVTRDLVARPRPTYAATPTCF
jgi:hypothetical protein